MRFPISCNAASRALFWLLGIGPGKAYVDVENGVIRAKLGWSGSVTIDRDAIAAIQRVDRIPWWLGIGIHGNLFGLLNTWAFNGARANGIKLTLGESARGRVLGVPIRARTVYFSLEDPAGFIAAARP